MSHIFNCPHQHPIGVTAEVTVSCSIRSDIPHETHFAKANGTLYLWDTGSTRDIMPDVKHVGTYTVTVEESEAHTLIHPDLLHELLKKALAEDGHEYKAISVYLTKVEDGHE